MSKDRKVFLYDTTLRDGAQSEGVSFSLDDKLRLTEALDDFGIHYIEGGWPVSNPKDEAYFKRVRSLNLKRARIAAFGSTHHPKNKAAEDRNVQLLLAAKTPVVTIVGKAWNMQATKVLGVSARKNLELIHSTITYLKKNVDEVIFDAEHFFDGCKDNQKYSIEVLSVALDAGADWLTLCDTNGGTLTSEVESLLGIVCNTFPGANIGIHCHNDSDCAVANSIAAIQKGARQLQGTINGIGERCGNTNLCSVIPNLQLKAGFNCVSKTKLKKLRELSRLAFELANMSQRPHQPYTGRSAFAHKGGIHVAAVNKVSRSYEHVEPEIVGNRRRVLVSDLSGKWNILMKAAELGLDIKSKDKAIKKILKDLKDLESQWFQFEGAEGSFELLIRKATGQWKRKFEIERARVVSNFSDLKSSNWAETVIKVRLPNGATRHSVAEGNGPVNALDKAVRSALVDYYPELYEVELHDFKVRLLDDKSKTAAVTRVLVESGDKNSRWGTVGVSPNIIEASWQALVDSLEYKLHQPKRR
ncbi:MAG TPA: citramalate synthase [Nitrospinota bacterium]|nr:citramalate synthase [Nitrospinota bacterium]